MMVAAGVVWRAVRCGSVVIRAVSSTGDDDDALDGLEVDR